MGSRGEVAAVVLHQTGVSQCLLIALFVLCHTCGFQCIMVSSVGSHSFWHMVSISVCSLVATPFFFLRRDLFSLTGMFENSIIRNLKIIH